MRCLWLWRPTLAMASSRPPRGPETAMHTSHIQLAAQP